MVEVLPDGDAMARTGWPVSCWAVGCCPGGGPGARHRADRRQASRTRSTPPSRGIARRTRRPHRRPARDAVDWSRVDVWWGDERFVPAGDDERNADRRGRPCSTTSASTRLACTRCPPRTPGTPTSRPPAAAYGDRVRRHGNGRFDVVMLGVGPDGHVASLFPGYPQLDVDDRVAVAVRDSPKPPPERVSLTFGALNRAAEVWFLVSGDGKAAAVARALGGADVHEIPATGVHGQSAQPGSSTRTRRPTPPLTRPQRAAIPRRPVPNGPQSPADPSRTGSSAATRPQRGACRRPPAHTQRLRHATTLGSSRHHRRV